MASRIQHIFAKDQGAPVVGYIGLSLMKNFFLWSKRIKGISYPSLKPSRGISDIEKNLRGEVPKMPTGWPVLFFEWFLGNPLF